MVLALRRRGLVGTVYNGLLAIIIDYLKNPPVTKRVGFFLETSRWNDAEIMSRHQQNKKHNG